MNNRFIDVTGQRFGRLVAVELAGRDARGRLWHCQCDCGASSIVAASTLRTGNTKSCGCLKREQERGGRSASHYKHGMTGSREHITWVQMRQRCTNPRNEGFVRYGGRGISVCERWLKFENFLADMGRRPSPRHTLERIDNNGNYEPGNCRWATRLEQGQNKRNNRFATSGGVTLTVAEWARRTGLRERTIQKRLAKGWSDNDALTVPPRGRGNRGVRGSAQQLTLGVAA